MAKKKSEEDSLKELKFEEGLARLEEIITAMERGKLDLDESVKHFEEGTRLYRWLQTKLDSAEGQVKAVLEGFDGKVALKDFENQAGR